MKVTVTTESKCLSSPVKAALIQGLFMSVDVFMTPRWRDQLAQRGYLSRPCTSNGMLFALRLEQEASTA